MSRKNQPIDRWYFSGDEAMHNTGAASAATDQSASYPGIFGGEGVVRLTLTSVGTGHGYKASPQPYGPDAPNLIYIDGTDNYDGLRRIVAVATDTIDIVAPFTAETLSTGDTFRPGFKFDHAVEFVGFELHLNTACATAEDLEIHKDADRGAGWDIQIYDKPMNTIKDLTLLFEEPVVVDPNDVVYFTWNNADDRLWGLVVYTKRLV